jgi:hypothetical protein
MDPRAPLWGCFVMFTVFCLWMFRRAVRHTSEGPFDRILDVLEHASDRLLNVWRRRIPIGRWKISAW